MGDSLLPTLMMLLAIVVVGVVLLAILITTRGKGKTLDKETYRTEWLKIENNLDKANDATYQFSILSADKLLDRALRELGVPGKDMGERLKKSDARFKNIDTIWAAHKIRNKIAHEVDAKIDRKVLRRMLAVYKNALKELGAI